MIARLADNHSVILHTDCLYKRCCKSEFQIVTAKKLNLERHCSGTVSRCRELSTIKGLFNLPTKIYLVFDYFQKTREFQRLFQRNKQNQQEIYSYYHRFSNQDHIKFGSNTKITLSFCLTEFHRRACVLCFKNYYCSCSFFRSYTHI